VGRPVMLLELFGPPGVSLPFGTVFVIRNPGLSLRVALAVWRAPVPWWHRRILLRRFAGVAAWQFFLRTRQQRREVVIFDEGLIHRVVNLFAWRRGPVPIAEATEYLRRIPLPDIALEVTCPPDIADERLTRRGLPLRLRARDASVVSEFLGNSRRAVALARSIVAPSMQTGVIHNDSTLEAVETILADMTDRILSRAAESSASEPDGVPREPSQTTRLTVLQVVANLEIGGAQEVVRTLARFLPAAGCMPIVVTFRDGPIRAQIEELGVPVVVLTGRYRSILAGPAALAELVRIRRDLARVIRDYRPEVIQTHLLRSLDFLVLSLRSERSVEAVFWTVHNALLDIRPDQLPAHRWLLRPKRVAHRLLYQLGARWCSALIAVSDEVGVALQRKYRPPRSKVVVIPNGVDLDRYGDSVDRIALRVGLSLPADARILIVVAKLLPQKGHRVLLDALSGGLPSDVHVVLAGEGPLKTSLVEQAARVGLSERVHFLGNRTDIPTLLAGSDLFVLPSLWEGLPIALLEAMASGLPVVASDVSGSRQVVVHGETGVLVPPGNSDELKSAIAALLGDPERARSMGRAGRERVASEFSAGAQAERHARLYRQTVNEALAIGTP
jgi:glycosyltransferase involved in cell wall biosynthesis